MVLQTPKLYVQGFRNLQTNLPGFPTVRARVAPLRHAVALKDPNLELFLGFRHLGFGSRV